MDMEMRKKASLYFSISIILIGLIGILYYFIILIIYDSFEIYTILFALSLQILGLICSIMVLTKGINLPRSIDWVRAWVLLGYIGGTALFTLFIGIYFHSVTSYGFQSGINLLSSILPLAITLFWTEGVYYTWVYFNLEKIKASQNQE